MKFSICKLIEGTFDIGISAVWEEYEKYLCICIFKIGFYLDFPCKED